MAGHKQTLLKHHRRNKRIAVGTTLLALAALALYVPWWVVPLILALSWIAHEAWFADHLFYSPRDDYHYQFASTTPSCTARIQDGGLQIDGDFAAADTLILQLHIQSSWLGRYLDPHVFVGTDRQDFERGVSGLRYLNLSGQEATVKNGQLQLRGRFCTIEQTATLYAFTNPDYAEQPLMVIAPHADDAELAAFGLYRRARHANIVTVTQGEIEAESYQLLGLNKVEAARLKGRLRVWDSLAIPLWGNLPQTHCVQLGYYCQQLTAMSGLPDNTFGSSASGEDDIRAARQHNPLALPGDADGQPTWRNLVADLVALLEHFRPVVVVTPHPDLDPHADHIASTQAVLDAIQLSTWKPDTLLLYANHLHDNDRWPMGPAGHGIALPPAIQSLPVEGLWSPSLDAAGRMDKAMALAMHHDLQEKLPTKQRIRRLIQRLLAARRWPTSGEDEFFRKAVRGHELFWVRTTIRARSG